MTNQIIKNVIANVIKYTIILTSQFPCEKYCPTIVEEIIEGNLQNVAIAINLIGFIGNNMTRDEIIQKLKRDENAEYTLRFEYENKKYVRAVKNDKNQLKDVYYEIKESELEEVKNQNLLDAFNAKYKHDANPILY